MRKISILIVFIVSALVTNATTYVSVMDGVFDDAATWGGSGFPTTNDDVIMSHVITTTGTERCNDLTIIGSGALTLNGTFYAYGDMILSTGTTVDIQSKTIRVRGEMTLNGIINGTTGRFYLQNPTGYSGPNFNLSGNGSVIMNGGRWFISRDLEILAGSNITTTAKLVLSKATLNNGIFTMMNMQAGTSSSWVNGAGATVKFGGTVDTDLALTASSADNTVIYNAMGSLDQTLLIPSLNRYQNLVIDGDDVASVKVFEANININGDLTIEGSTLRAGTNSSPDIDIKGNWNNYGGVFDPHQGFVAFNGSNDQEIDQPDGVEHFYDLYCSGSGSLSLFVDLIVDRNLTIEKTFDTFGQALYVGGNWTTTLPVDLDGSVVTFGGNNNGTITGNITFENVTIDKSFTTTNMTIASGTTVKITGSLEIPQGVLNTNDNLVIVSNALGAGRVGDLSNGTINGQVEVQRFSSNSLNGWHLMCSPVQGTTLADWDDDMITTGYPGSDYPAFDFNNATYYNESISGGNKDDGLVDASSSTESTSDMKGWRIYIAAGETNIDVKGDLIIGSQTIPVSYTDNGAPFEDGWNLVPNPYASAIDWDAATGWTRSGINDAIYVWDPVTETYTTYIAGIGTNGGSRYVPSTQAFWVQASSASPSLTINEPVKVDNAVTFKNKVAREDYFKLILSDAQNVNCEVAVRIDEKATDLFDPSFDAYYLASGNETKPALAIKDENEVAYSVYSINELSDQRMIPLYVKVGSNGQYAFSFENLSNFKKSSCMTLIDSELGMEYPVKEGAKVNVNLDAGEYQDRFVLKMSSPIQTNVINQACEAGKDRIQVVLPEVSESWELTMLNSSGVNVYENTVQGGVIESSNLQGGDYSVQLISQSGNCISNTTELNIPITHNPEVSFETSPSLLGGANGAIFTSVKGALSPFDFEWDNGAVTSDLINVAPGLHSLTITDARNCSYSTSIVVEADGLAQEISDKSLENNAISLVNHEGYFSVGFNYETKQNLEISVYNSIGQIVYSKTHQNMDVDVVNISSGDLTGVTLVVFRNIETNVVTIKRIAL